MAVEKNRYMQQGIGQAIRAGAFIYIAVYENWVTLPRPLEGRKTSYIYPYLRPVHKPPVELSRPYICPLPESEFIREVWFSVINGIFKSDLNILLKKDPN